MKSMYWKRAILPVLIGLFLLIGALTLPMLLQETQPVAAQGPEPGTVVGVGTYTAFPTQQISHTGSAATTYSSAPYLYRGLDVSYSRNWNSADVFVVVDDWDTGDALTVTAQFSPDQSNWADAYYTAEGWVLPLSYSGLMTNTSVLTNSSGVTNTTTSTQSLTASASNTFSGSSGTRVSESVPYRIVASADGTDYVRIPIVGMYLRYKLEYSGTLTATIQTTYRNNGGS
jgi:hypothetical protein